jgi:hypothetical protein
MIIILGVVLSVSIILYSEVKIIRNMGNSVAAFYAGDSGVEKVLYYDKQVLVTTTPCTGTGQSTCGTGQTCNGSFCTVPRGLCLMTLSSNASPCTTGTSGDASIYCCNYLTPTPNCPNPVAPTGNCDPTTCSNCSISFATTFDGRTYYVVASVSNGTPAYYLDVKSRGVFGSAQRQIDISITTP